MLAHIYQYTKCNLLLYRVQAKSSKCWNLWPAAVLPLPLLPLTAPSHTGATTLPPLPFYSFHSSSLPSALPKLKKKSSSWFFSLKRAEAHWIWQGPPTTPNSLGSGYRQGGEEAGRTGKGKERGTRGGGLKERKKVRGVKVLHGTFL